MQPDPFVRPNIPGETCFIKIMLTSYPDFTYHEDYLALHAICSAQRETREFDASAFGLVYRDGVVGEGEHIGTVIIRPFSRLMVESLGLVMVFFCRGHM